jgi:hypothetical protein
MRPITFGRGRANPLAGRIARQRRGTGMDDRISDAVLIDPAFDNQKPDAAELRSSLGLDDHRHPAAE